MIKDLSQPPAYKVALHLQIAMAFITMAVLHGPAAAKNDEYKDLLNCLEDSKKCSSAEPKTPLPQTRTKVYEATASDVPLRPIPRYASSVDDQLSVNDCVISGMKGVSNDVAASIIRTACESKSKALRRERDLQNQMEYGASVSTNDIEAVPTRSAGSITDRLLISNVRGRPDAVITYVSFNISSMTKAGQCGGEDMRLAYKVSLPARKSVALQIPAFYPAESPGVCATVIEVRAKPSTWSDSLKNLTSIGEIAPLKVDPFP